MDQPVSLSEDAYEEEHVHQVYNKIASHFSSTRFKPWPVVDEFLRDLPTGSIGLDIGCGNGKYLTVRNDVFIVASDRSSQLIQFATQHQPHSAIVADTLNLPHPLRTFDFAICIAVIHHFSTPLRRQASIQAILAQLHRPSDKHSTSTSSNNKKSGQALIFVWALEQKTSRRGWDADHEQDVLVPWVLKQDVQGRKKDKKRRGNSETKTIDGSPSSARNEDSTASDQNNGQTSQLPKQDTDQTYQRYYHLYRQGELEEDITKAGGRVVRHGYDRDNWWAICEPAAEQSIH